MPFWAKTPEKEAKVIRKDNAVVDRNLQERFIAVRLQRVINFPDAKVIKTCSIVFFLRCYGAGVFCSL